jgi:hypothetical protein
MFVEKKKIIFQISKTQFYFLFILIFEYVGILATSTDMSVSM